MNTFQQMLILSAGMPRSASTWQYNVIRLALLNSSSIKKPISHGWIGDLRESLTEEITLIKIHNFEKSLVSQSNIIFYSYRDIRDSLASSYRKFNKNPTLDYADFLINNHNKWINVANYVIRYETMLLAKHEIVSDILNHLSINDIDPKRIIEKVSRLNYESPGSRNDIYHNENLYHQNHMTDGRHGSWTDILEPTLVDEIQDKHRAWFVKYGYPIY